MVTRNLFPQQQNRCCSLFRVLILAALLTIPVGVVKGQQAGNGVLHIGTADGLTANSEAAKQKAAMKSLQSFIKEETGFNNEIYRQKDWKVLAEKMAQGQLQIGVFEGHEFAWAQAERPDLKPLALAVNIFVYPVVHVVTQNKNPAKDFAGLQGYSLSVTALGQNNLRLFIDRESQACGKKTEAFFSSISAPANAEEALDDVVDGKVQATVVDRSSLTAYKERKPGRFNRLKVVAQSQPLSPPVVAYYTAKVDDSTLQRLKTGLLDAAKKEKGETLLTLFHLTGFVDVPADFEQVLAQMLKAYPPPAKTK